MTNFKNNSWISSFDFEITKEPPAVKKHTRSQTEDKAPPAESITYDVVPAKRNKNSLSLLLAGCEPQKPAELVTSRQKQKEILDWLQNKVKRGQPSMLVLSGPAGCGKTAAIKVLAKQQEFSITEWITPIDQALDENNRVMRQSDRFQDFVIRATRYNSVLSDCTSRLILVKDFPHVYFYDKESFFSLLEMYFQMGKEPLVFVCTETGNSKMLQTLFPANVREKFGIDLINLNAVTQASIKNALKRVSGIFNKTAGHMMNVSQEKIDEILSNNIGDIRSAVLNLIFISLKVPEKQGKTECSSREESLGLLHGIGRVINPKRVPHADGWTFVHDPDKIAGFFESQATLFVNFLQENYLNTLRGIEEVNKCSDILSLADILKSEWRDPNLNKVTLSYCTRGVMVANEKPVPGWNPVRKPQNDRIEVRRCLASAEVRWYESIIGPKSKSKEESLVEVDMDIIIE